LGTVYQQSNQIGEFMQQCFTNATVCWNEFEIARRESLIREIPILLKGVWQNLNRSVDFKRIETPILTPASYLQGHIDAKFELINTGTRGYLRPETTAGTFEAMNMEFHQKESMKKHLPLCLWQVGLSFRDEKKPDTMRASKLRLVQFYQMEFQLFCSHGTKAPYLEAAINALTSLYGGEQEHPEDLPHYSEKTIDWMMDGLEVAGLSKRTDWEHGEVYEVAIGLDRLVAKQLQTLH
jgi:hypothetical protein